MRPSPPPPPMTAVEGVKLNNLLKLEHSKSLDHSNEIKWDELVIST